MALVDIISESLERTFRSTNSSVKTSHLTLLYIMCLHSVLKLGIHFMENLVNNLESGCMVDRIYINEIEYIRTHTLSNYNDTCTCRFHKPLLIGILNSIHQPESLRALPWGLARWITHPPLVITADAFMESSSESQFISRRHMCCRWINTEVLLVQLN